MVRGFYPRSFYVRDAIKFDVKSATLYHEIADCESLVERHGSIRENYVDNLGRLA